MNVRGERGQLAECPRCGNKMLASGLLHDGRNPRLLVCAECYDPPHEAERPFKPKATEGKARFPVAPELLPDEEIVLSVLASGGVPAWDPMAWLPGAWADDAWEESGVQIDWTRPAMHNVRIELYEVFRAFDNGAFELIATNNVEYSDFMGIENEPEGYSDAGAESAGTYRYYVEGVTGNGRRYRSNMVSVEIAA